MNRVVGLVCIFLAALSWLYFLAKNAPTLSENEKLQFPSSVEDLKKTAEILTRLFDHVRVTSYVWLSLTTALQGQKLTSTRLIIASIHHVSVFFCEIKVLVSTLDTLLLSFTLYSTLHQV